MTVVQTLLFVLCLQMMTDRGLEPLTVTQIRSWWSTYHRKRQQQQQSQINSASSAPGTRGQSQEPAVHQTADHNVDQLSQLTPLSGTESQYSNKIIEWKFDEGFSQSTIQGRNGSNACTFIALYMGRFVKEKHLAFPVEKQLSVAWKDSLYEAMTVGNDIHDEIFGEEAVDVVVDEAIEIAGEQCAVKELGQDFGFYQKRGAKKALTKAFQDMSNSLKKSSSLLTMCGRTVLFLTEQLEQCYLLIPMVTRWNILVQLLYYLLRLVLVILWLGLKKQFPQTGSINWVLFH